MMSSPSRHPPACGAWRSNIDRCIESSCQAATSVSVRAGLARQPVAQRAQLRARRDCWARASSCIGADERHARRPLRRSSRSTGAGPAARPGNHGLVGVGEARSCARARRSRSNASRSRLLLARLGGQRVGGDAGGQEGEQHAAERGARHRQHRAEVERGDEVAGALPVHDGRAAVAPDGEQRGETGLLRPARAGRARSPGSGRGAGWRRGPCAARAGRSRSGESASWRTRPQRAKLAR